MKSTLKRFNREHRRILEDRAPVIRAVREAEKRGLFPVLLNDGKVAMVAGGSPVAAAEPASVAHPLAAPTLSGNAVTVDTMLQQPTRVTRMIMDLTLQRFIADRVFASAGSVTGGAVIYDQATLNELYASRDVQQVSPGGEFPLITSERQVPKVAEVEKWGGKVFITDEAKDRNNAALFTNEIRKLANTIVRKINQRALAELDTSIEGSGQKANGNDWSEVVTTGAEASSAELWPAADFAGAWQASEEDELGVTYDLWIVNPQEYARLVVIYGALGLRELLSALNLAMYVSNRVTAGKAYVVAQQQVGEMRVEQALATETWRDPEGRQRTWVQSSVRPVMYVTNPYSVLRYEKLAG